MKYQTLKNGRGEALEIRYTAKTTKQGQPGTAGCNRVMLVIEADKPITVGAEVRAVYASGTPVNKFEVLDGNAVAMSTGDVKRLATYPIFIYVNGDKSKRSRFQLRSL